MTFNILCTFHRFVSNLFANADVNSDGVVDLKEILKLLEKMNMAVDRNHAMQICQVMLVFITLLCFSDFSFRSC